MTVFFPAEHRSHKTRRNAANAGRMELPPHDFPPDLEALILRLLVGLDTGEPITEPDDLFGTAVQLAALVTSRGGPGRVLATWVVADLCAGKSCRCRIQVQLSNA